jgi:hypothetical protein
MSSMTLPFNTTPDYLTMSISIKQMDQRGRAGKEDNQIQIKALLDTGALAGDFISQELVNKLGANHLLETVHTTICSGFDNNCDSYFKSILVNLSYINEISFKSINLVLKPLVLPKRPIDLIIGNLKYGYFCHY